MTKNKEPYYELKLAGKGLYKLLKGPSIDEQIAKEKKTKELAEAMKAAESSKEYIKEYKRKLHADRKERIKKLLGIK